MTTPPQAVAISELLALSERSLAMALQHIRICAPDPTVEAALEAIDLATLATPARVVSDAELPELPEPEVDGSVYHEALKICVIGKVHYTADQMHAYARAALTLTAGADAKDGDALRIAVAGYIGPLDDPRIGWRGGLFNPSSSDKYRCEGCGFEWDDGANPVHSEGCPTAKLIAAYTALQPVQEKQE